MKHPQELKYTKDHEWIRLENDLAYIGITDFAQNQLGDIVYIDINTLNTKIEQFQSFGVVEAVKTVSDLFIPVTGEIIEVNPLLESNPEILNTDPYDQGWLIKVKVEDLNQLDTLLTNEEYLTYCGL